MHVRAARGQRVTIDGGLSIQPPSSHLWIWDLEHINNFKQVVHEGNLVLGKTDPRPAGAAFRVEIRPHRA